MVLGRTSSNAIKTKTDGGLRAVECACCGGCPCTNIKITGALFEILKNSTTGTCNGFNPVQFDLFIDGTGFNAYWNIGQAYFGPIQFYVGFNFITKCLKMQGYNQLNFINSGPISISNDIICCSGSSFIECIEASFTINDQTFPAYHERVSPDVLPPPMNELVPLPNFVFS